MGELQIHVPYIFYDGCSDCFPPRGRFRDDTATMVDFVEIDSHERNLSPGRKTIPRLHIFLQRTMKKTLTSREDLGTQMWTPQKRRTYEFAQ